MFNAVLRSSYFNWDSPKGRRWTVHVFRRRPEVRYPKANSACNTMIGQVAFSIALQCNGPAERFGMKLDLLKVILLNWFMHSLGRSTWIVLWGLMVYICSWISIKEAVHLILPAFDPAQQIMRFNRQNWFNRVRVNGLHRVGSNPHTGFFKKTANQLEVWRGELDTPGPPISMLCDSSAWLSLQKNGHSCSGHWEAMVNNIETGGPGASGGCWNFLVDGMAVFFEEPGMCPMICWSQDGFSSG